MTIRTPAPSVGTVPVRIPRGLCLAIRLCQCFRRRCPTPLQAGERPLQSGNLRIEVVLPTLQPVQDLNQVDRAGRRQGVAGSSTTHLDHARKTENGTQYGDRRSGRDGSSRQYPMVGNRVGFLHRPSGRFGAVHALKMCRRMAAALPKMRMPSTTTTAVDNCEPTPS